MKLVYDDWKTLYPGSKVTIGALKICLSKLLKGHKINNDSDCLQMQKEMLEKKDRECVNVLIGKDVDDHVLGNTNKAISSVLSDEIATLKIINEADKTEIQKENIKRSKKKQCSYSSLKAKKHRDAFTAKMKEDVIHYYNIVLNGKSIRKQSKRDIEREVKKLWLEHYPQSSMSLRVIGKIISNFIGSNKRQKQCPSPESHKEDIIKEDVQNNIPDDSMRLRHMHKLAVILSSQPIFRYICYNCGRLLTSEST